MKQECGYYSRYNQYDTNDNVFANDIQHFDQSESISNTCAVETDDSNVTPDSPDMCDNDIQDDQNDVECDDERVALANLIANLKLDVDENKKIQKQLKKANATLTQELTECKSILAETSRTLGESNSIRDSCLVALQNKQTEFERYKAFNDRTVDYDKLEHKLNEALGLLAQKEIDIKEGLKVKAYEISVVKEKHDELVKQSLLTKSHYEGLVKEKTKVITDLKLKEEKDIDKMISMENQPTFANPMYLKKAQNEIPCLYAIPHDQSDLANRLVPDQEETMTLDNESRSKLNKDLVKPFDYTKLNKIVDQACVKYSNDLLHLRNPTAQDMEILVKTCLMPLALKTQNDSFAFVHELKQEIHADLKYVESLKDELESDKAEFSNMYDMLFQEYVSNDIMCSYLQSSSDLDEITELQCLYLHKVRECDCLAQKLYAQTEFFDKPSIVRKPNAQRIPKPSVLGKPAPFSDSLERKYFAKKKPVSKTNESEGLSKRVTPQNLPSIATQAVRNTNVIKSGMYRITSSTTQTKAPQLNQTSRNTNPRVSTSTGVAHKTNVSRPQPRSNQMKDKVVPNTSHVKFKKTEVEEHPRISSISNQTKSVTACNDSLNSRTSNVNAVCATCGKCVFNSNHDACVSKFLKDVNARTKKPNVVPISTRKPKSQANKSVATPHKKTVASESTITNSKSYYRMLYKKTNKAWKWWIAQQCPSAYTWVPKIKKKWVRIGPNIKSVTIYFPNIDASVRSYMSGHILYVHPVQSQTTYVPEQQYQLYLSMKADPQLQQQDIAIWLALQMKFERLQVPQTTCRTSAVRPRDQDDPHDDAHPEGENSAKRQKTSEYEAYVSGESSSGQVNEEERGPSTSGNQEQVDDYDFWTDSYASDDDEIPTKQVSQDIMEEVSLTIDEAKLKKMADEMLRQRCTSGDEHQYHIDQMKNFLKSDIVWESRKEILISPHPQKTTPLVQSYLLYKETERAWKTKGRGLFKFKDHSSHQDILELGHEHKFITEIVARRANECIVSITEPDYKNLNKNDIEDMYLLIMNGKVPDYAETWLLWSLSVFIRRVEKHKMFSIIYEPVHGIIYKNSKKEKRVMRHSEIHKFCDATLNRVLKGLKSYNNDVKYGYVQRELTADEVEYLKLFEEEIEVRLKYRNQMRRWEMYVNGRPLGPRRERPE
ncbi:hypothetical protein Tco_1352443 [Tanacetum coccineum]